MGPGRFLGRPPVIFDGLEPDLALGELVGNRVQIELDGRPAVALPGPGDLGMQRPPPAFQQAFIGRVLYQRMPEHVPGVRRRAGLQHETAFNELGE